MRDPHSADVATRIYGSTNWVYTNPHERLHGAKAEWAKWVGPTGIVGPSRVRLSSSGPSSGTGICRYRYPMTGIQYPIPD